MTFRSLKCWRNHWSCNTRSRPRSQPLFPRLRAWTTTGILTKFALFVVVGVVPVILSCSETGGGTEVGACGGRDDEGAVVCAGKGRSDIETQAGSLPFVSLIDVPPSIADAAASVSPTAADEPEGATLSVPPLRIRPPVPKGVPVVWVPDQSTAVDRCVAAIGVNTGKS